MLKQRMTAKSIRELDKHDKPVFKVGYCELQNILKWSKPVAYTCDVYGWYSDLYEFTDFYICTGYRPVGRSTPDDLLLLFKIVDDKAKKYSHIDFTDSLENCYFG